eukprot:gene1494-1977_t
MTTYPSYVLPFTNLVSSTLMTVRTLPRYTSLENELFTSDHRSKQTEPVVARSPSEEHAENDLRERTMQNSKKNSFQLQRANLTKLDPYQQLLTSPSGEACGGVYRMSSSEALQIGLLLRQQEEQFGTNMYDSLLDSDESELERLTLSENLTTEEALLEIFIRKYNTSRK